MKDILEFPKKKIDKRKDFFLFIWEGGVVSFQSPEMASNLLQ